MRVALAVVLLMAITPSALAESEPRTPREPRDGGLRVCCGASFGYIGGSGSASGSIEGPGSSRSGNAPAPAVDPGPNALENGEVAPVLMPVVADTPRTAEQASGVNPGTPIVIALAALVAASIAIARRHPAARGRRDDQPGPLAR